MGDSAQLRKLKLDGLYEDLKNEVRVHEAIITDVKNALLGWSDLLRKMGGEERRVGNDDYNESTVFIMLRILWISLREMRKYCGSIHKRLGSN